MSVLYLIILLVVQVIASRVNIVISSNKVKVNEETSQIDKSLLIADEIHYFIYDYRFSRHIPENQNHVNST